jgi:hypothetical protein
MAGLMTDRQVLSTTTAEEIGNRRGYGEEQSVLPTGRNFGRKTQKWPHKNLSGRKKQRPNFWPISQKIAEKWPNFFGVCISHEGLDYLKK